MSIDKNDKMRKENTIGINKERKSTQVIAICNQKGGVGKYIRQDASQSYREVLLFSIGALYELQE